MIAEPIIREPARLPRPEHPCQPLMFTVIGAMADNRVNSVLTMQGRDKSPIGVVHFT